MKRVPADWEPQRCVWIAWPHNRDTWPKRFGPIPDCFRRIIRLIAEVVPVHVIGKTNLRSDAALDLIPDVTWFDIETNDCWIRDYGPTFVVEHEAKGYAIDWRYNAWGGKYPPWDADDAATAQMIDRSDWNRVDGTLCLEGGALEWDGTGRLLTTTNCLVTKTRNPNHSKQQIENQLRELTGARDIFWVDGGGIAGDDTDGHIDQLARFIDPQTIVVAVVDDPEDPNHAGLQANYQSLCRWADSTSPRVVVHRLPTPPARFVDGQRLPQSYCNFLRIGPDRMLVPNFGSATSDARALHVLSKLARRTTPCVDVISIDCRDLVWGLGALHCASCNEPATTATDTIVKQPKCAANQI